MEQRTPYQSQRQAPCLPLFHRDASVSVRSGSPATEYQTAHAYRLGAFQLVREWLDALPLQLHSQLKKIVMLGRQAGYFLIVACQRPDAKYFSDGIRDNFNFRVGLGRISELGYGMLFGSDVKKQFFQKRIKGRGYCDVGTSVISEFYTPLVPKGHDFLQEIGRLEEKRTASNES